MVFELIQQFIRINRFYRLLFLFLIISPNLYLINNFQTTSYQTNLMSNQDDITVNTFSEDEYCGDTIDYSKISNYRSDFTSYSTEAISIDGNFAYVTRSDIFIFNITDSSSPTYIGRFNYEYGDILKAQVTNSIGYLICRNLGVLIVNFTDPYNPIELGKCGRFDGRVRTNTYEYVVDGQFENHYAYVTVAGYKKAFLGWNRFSALYIFDLSDPIFPKPIGYHEGIFSRLIISNGFCYLVKSYYYFHSGSTDILDVRNPSHIRKVADIYSSSISYVSDGIAIVRNYENITLYDVSNPSKPAKKAIITNFNYNSFDTSNDRLFLTNGSAIDIYNINDLTTPQLIYHLPIDKQTSFIKIKDNLLYLDSADFFVDFKIYDVSISIKPISVGEVTYGSFGGCNDITVKGNFAFVSNDFGMNIINISNSAYPSEISAYDRYSDPVFLAADISFHNYYYSYIDFQITIEDNLVYLISDDAIEIINCTDIFNPHAIAIIEPESYYDFDKFIVYNHYIYVTTEPGKLTIYNCTNPNYPHVLSEYEIDNDISDLFIQNDSIIFLLNYNRSSYTYEFMLDVIDISDKSNPELIGTNSDFLWGYSKCVIEDDTLFVLLNNEFLIVDFSDPFNPLNISCIEFVRSSNYYSYYFGNIEKCDNKIYIPLGREVIVLDVSNLNDPVVYARFEYLPEYFSYEAFTNHGIIYEDEDLEIGRIKVVSDKIYVSRYDDGFDIIGPDSDCDFMSDYLEINVYHTNPVDHDMDDDGIPDGLENLNGLNPFNESDAFLDYDSDGLHNLLESFYFTNPFSNDTDQDGLSDQYEINNQLNALYFDTDQDGLSDGVEVDIFGTDPFNPDTDADNLDDFYEVARGKNPFIYDRWKRVFLGWIFPIYLIIPCACPWYIRKIRTEIRMRNLRVERSNDESIN
ncbi:MAG: hypothetical protein FK733_04410 [Asgard group archaeon]|nr:hypothetical protein [Asgard group archaeon]